MINLFLACAVIFPVPPVSASPAAAPQTQPPCEVDRVGFRSGGPGDGFGTLVEASGSGFAVVGTGSGGQGNTPFVVNPARSIALFEADGLQWNSTSSSNEGGSSLIEPGFSAIALDSFFVAFANSDEDTVTLQRRNGAPANITAPLTLAPGVVELEIRDLALTPGELLVLTDEYDATSVRSMIHRFTVFPSLDLTPTLLFVDATQVGPTELLGLVGPAGPGTDVLGGGLAILAGRILVGLPGDDTGAFDGGTLREVQIASNGLFETATILPPSPSAYAGFGSCLASDGLKLIVGSRGAVDPISIGEQAFIYGTAGGAVSLVTQLDLGPTDGSSDVAVDLLGNLAVVGLPGTFTAQPSAGSVRVFRFDGGAWSPDGSFQGLAPEAGDGFGSGVALLPGELVAVGRPRSVGPPSERGAVSVVSLDGSNCASTLASPERQTQFANNLFSFDLALAGGPDLAGDLAIVLPSTQAPGAGLTLDGITIPLTSDALTTASLHAPGALGFQNFVTTLDDNGNSEAPSILGPQLSIALIGLELYFTWIALEITPSNVSVQFAGESVSVGI